MSRAIYITRKSRRDPYGFEFTTSKLDGKHVVCNVQPDSPAYSAGLRDGDLILEVNDESVSGFWHDAVEMKMSRFHRRLSMLVVDDLNDFIRERRKSLVTQQLNKNKNIEVISFNGSVKPSEFLSEATKSGDDRLLNELNSYKSQFNSTLTKSKSDLDLINRKSSAHKISGKKYIE